jgi:flagellar biosynthetic protein FliR
MEAILSIFFLRFDSFLLIMVRMSGMFLLSPIFGKKNVPNNLKVGLIFFISVIASNIIKVPNLNYKNNIIGYAIIILQELLVGLIIGLVSYLILSSCFLAGQMIDTQIGFGIVSVLDPQSNAQVPISGNLYYIIMILMFFLSNGHHVLISAVIESYNIVPIGGIVITSKLLMHIAAVFTEMFVIAIKISIPIVATMLVIDITLGIISRTMPQLNIFAVGVPLKLVIGLIIMFFTFTILVNIISNMFNSMYIDIYKALRGMVK